MEQNNYMNECPFISNGYAFMFSNHRKICYKNLSDQELYNFILQAA